MMPLASDLTFFGIKSVLRYYYNFTGSKNLIFSISLTLVALLPLLKPNLIYLLELG